MNRYILTELTPKLLRELKEKDPSKIYKQVQAFQIEEYAIKDYQEDELCHDNLILIPVSGNETGWISVGKRLPELKPYYDDKAMRTMQPVSFECIATDGKTSFVEYYSIDEGFHKSITHWMPLPEPPKK